MASPNGIARAADYQPLDVKALGPSSNQTSSSHGMGISPAASTSSPTKHNIGTTTDAAPATSNAATQSIVHFNYRGWFPPEDELGSTESRGSGSSGSASTARDEAAEWQQNGLYPPHASASDQDFVLTEGEDNGEDAVTDESADSGFSLATSPTPDNGDGSSMPLKHKNSSEPHGPLPVASTIDTPQLNNAGRGSSSGPTDLDQPTDGNGMLWRPLQSEPQVSLRNLGDEIKTFVDDHLTLTNEEVSERERFIAKLRIILKETISPQCKLKVHGSFVTSLALRESDIDFLVTDYSPMQPIAAIDKMTLALLQFTNDDSSTKALPPADVSVLNRATGPSPSPGTYVPRHEGDVFTVQAIVFTRVPIIKITEKSTGIKGDLSFGGGHHDESMRLTRKLLTRFPTARPLLLFLKNILKDGQMGESASGGLSSFALYLLVMHFYNIRFHCDGRMWEPTRSTNENAEVGSTISSAATPVEGSAPSKFASSGSTMASPAGTSSAVAALSGTRLANVGPRIEEFLSGNSAARSSAVVDGQLPTSGHDPDGLTTTSTPLPQSLADESDAPYDCEEENDPRTLGEVFCLFCWYYSEFEIQTKGIVFDEEGNSYVVPKPDSLRGKATLHMTSPFDSGYDITARMTCIQAFQQLLFLVTVIITAGAKEHSLSLSSLHAQIRECFVDYPEPFDDTAYRIYSKSTQLLTPFPPRGRGQGSRHHGHKAHGSAHGGHSGAPQHQQFTYFHSQGSYNVSQQYQQMHGFGHNMPHQQAPSQVPMGGPHHNHHYHRDPNAGVNGGGSTHNAQLPLSVGNVERRSSEGRHGTPPLRHVSHSRGDSNVGMPPQQAHIEGRTADATTSTNNQTIPRTATVTTQTTASIPAAGMHQHSYMHGGMEQPVYPQGFFPPYGPFPHQNPMGYPHQYYGGYPYGNGGYMGGSQQVQNGPTQVNPNAPGGPGGSPASLPVAPTTSYPKMKRGIGKASPYEHPNAILTPHESQVGSTTSNSMLNFPSAGRGRGGGKGNGSVRHSPPSNPTTHSLPMPMMHQGFYPQGKIEQVMVLPPSQMIVPQPQPPQQQLTKGRAKKGSSDQPHFSTPTTTSAPSEAPAQALSLSPAPVARYVPPCRKKKGEADANPSN